MYTQFQSCISGERAGSASKKSTPIVSSCQLLWLAVYQRLDP